MGALDRIDVLDIVVFTSKPEASMCFTQPVQPPQVFDFQTSTLSRAKAVPPDSMNPASTAALAAV
jgi:hypothetical protein